MAAAWQDGFGMSNAPVFIVGTERSGSNLLRLILDSHPSIVVPHPPHVMRYFTPLLPLYGDLADNGRFAALVRDVRSLVEAHIHPWPWIPSEEELLRRSPRHDLISVYRALHDAVRDRAGKPRWGCKSTFMVDHLDGVVAEWPEARIIWLYRDPRDVAASSRESVFSTFHPSRTAALWSAQQRAGLEGERRYPANTLRLVYERLVAAPEPEMRRVCDFLGESFHPPMLEWFRGDEAKQSASLSESWANTAAPMRTERIERWRKQLSPDDIYAVESIAAETMAELGYAPSLTSEQRDPALATSFRRFRWAAGDLAAWLRVEWRSLRRDQNVGRRYRRALLLRRIRWRLRVGRV
jgi:hypothetical protein